MTTKNLSFENNEFRAFVELDNGDEAHSRVFGSPEAVEAWASASNAEIITRYKNDEECNWKWQIEELPDSEPYDAYDEETIRLDRGCQCGSGESWLKCAGNTALNGNFCG